MRCLRTALPLATHGASCLAAAAAGNISRNDCDACGDCAACGGRSVTFGMASGVALMLLTSNWDVKLANLFRVTGHDEFIFERRPAAHPPNAPPPPTGS